MGHIGKRHATMIQQHEATELIGVADIDESLKETLEHQFNVPVFSSLEQMIAAGIQPEVLSICTPNNSHAALSILGLDQGFHVLCEKPMGLKKSACEAVIFKALQKNKLVFCVMQNRYSPPAVWLKKMVDANHLGRIYLVQINCYWNRDQRYYKSGSWKGKMETDGGVLFTQFSHFIDMMYWLFGDITNINARFMDFNHSELTEFEDSGVVHFDFVQGGTGILNFSTSVWDANFESSITIIGEKGTIKVGGQYMDQVSYCHVKDYEMPSLPPSNPPNDYGHYKGSAANHHYVIQNVVDTLRGDHVATTNAMEGLKVVEIIEQIYQFRKPK